MHCQIMASCAMPGRAVPCHIFACHGVSLRAMMIPRYAMSRHPARGAKSAGGRGEDANPFEREDPLHICSLQPFHAQTRGRLFAQPQKRRSSADRATSTYGEYSGAHWRWPFKAMCGRGMPVMFARDNKVFFLCVFLRLHVYRQVGWEVGRPSGALTTEPRRSGKRDRHALFHVALHNDVRNIAANLGDIAALCCVGSVTS